MEKVRLHQFSSPEEMVAAAAREWVVRADQWRQAGQVGSVALSGGRVRPLFESMVAAARGHGVSMDHLEFFWSDERCVPVGDAESNFRGAEEFLFGPLGIEAGRVHRIFGELGGEAAAARANADFQRVLGGGALDLVLLGMGEDGHVASLFPGGPADSGEGPYRPVVGPKPPPERVTLGYGALAAAREVWVLTSGAGKERALSESLAMRGTPLAGVIRSREETRIFSAVPGVAGGGVPGKISADL